SEHITVYKTLSLVGESSDNTIIDGGGIGTAIYVTASGVNITGFKVTNSGSHIDDAGLKIDSVGNCYVAYNNLSSNSGNAILLLSSSVNTISRNIISDNDVGIASLYSVINTIDGNVFMDNWLSIELFRSLGDTVTNNTISDSDLGVYLYDSEDIVVLNNSMIRSGILIEGYNLASWDSHTIDTSNTVNGKPVYYWKNVSGGSVPSDAGQVILANCTRVAIENQTLSNGSVGILLGFSWENTIANNTLSSNKHSGVMLESSTNNIVASNKVSNGYFGIYSFFSSNNNTFVNNTIFSNNTAGTDVYMIGFYLYSSHYSTISNNRIFDTWIGIYPNFSTNNTISDNVASNNSLGIFLGSSVMCTVINNTMMESGIYLDGDSINHWNTHTIDATNSVNGKPVYYLKNATGGTIPAGSGEVILGNSSGVVIENQNLSDGSVGIELGFSWNNVITNNTVSSNNWEGIALHSSDGNIIANNTASANEYYGIHIAASRSNEVRSNRMASNGISISGDSLIQWNSHTIDTSNTVNGNPVYYWKDITGGTIPLDAGQVILANCRLVEIENQNLSDGSVGILLGFSHNNMIANNTASSNSQEAILLYSSDGNTLVNNTLSNNGMGIYLVFSDGNAIYHNSFINSSEQALDIGDFNQWDDGYPSGGNY
ncbi:MAG: right-handed parallel beta-helix repeat-containing protein, partial [Thermoplasmata archaeon]|nr:right-handed parallel beta-helix repeat-containing protein [Thermoplasmata archaeon]